MGWQETPLDLLPPTYEQTREVERQYSAQHAIPSPLPTQTIMPLYPQNTAHSHQYALDELSTRRASAPAFPEALPARKDPNLSKIQRLKQALYATGAIAIVFLIIIIILSVFTDKYRQFASESFSPTELPLPDNTQPGTVRTFHATYTMFNTSTTTASYTTTRTQNFTSSVTQLSTSTETSFVTIQVPQPVTLISTVNAPAPTTTISTCVPTGLHINTIFCMPQDSCTTPEQIAVTNQCGQLTSPLCHTSLCQAKNLTPGESKCCSDCGCGG